MAANYVSDMDSVINEGHEILHGANAFIDRLTHCHHRFTFLTNSSIRTPSGLRRKL